MIYTVLAQRNNSSGDAKAMRSFRKYINEKNQNHSLLIVPIHIRPRTQRKTWPRAKAYIFLCGCQTQLKSTVII